MALTANTFGTEILKDSSSTLLIRASYWSVGNTDQVSNLALNVSTLSGRTMTITGVLADPNNPVSFIPGEALLAQDNAAGYVLQTWSPNATHFVASVLLSNSQVQFSNNDVITGARSNNAFTVGADGAVSDQVILALTGATWSIPSTTSVGVEFVNANTSLTDEAIRVSGSGFFGKNALPFTILPAAATRSVNSSIRTTGDIAISTYGIGAKGGYTLILEFRKQSGFAQQPIY